MSTPQPVTRRDTNVTHHHFSKGARDLLEPDLSEATKREYKKAWNYFNNWCNREGFTPLPATPAVVIEYIYYLRSRLKFNTIAKRITAIGQVHVYADLDNPSESKYVRRALNNLKRKKRKNEGETVTRKAPLLRKHLKRIMKRLDSSISGLRDAAMLSLGYTGAFRRSELTQLKYGHLRFDDKGVRVYLPTSKTDQDGQGNFVWIQYGNDPEICPVTALKRWIETAGIEAGPVFRRIDRHGNVYEDGISTDTVAIRVKKNIEAIGLDPSKYSGHSMRAGTVTQGCIDGYNATDIMDHCRHKQFDTFREYNRRANGYEKSLQLA